MPLTVQEKQIPSDYILLDPQADILDLALLSEFMRQRVILHGLLHEDVGQYQGALLERFRGPMTPEETRRALFNTTRLSAEQKACLLFDLYVSYFDELDEEAYDYDYMCARPLFSSEYFASNGQRIQKIFMNCRGHATNFAVLLYAFGFDWANMYWQVSNPSDDRSTKVVKKPAVRIGADEIQGHHGIAVVTPGRPTGDEGLFGPSRQARSNGFRLFERPDGSRPRGVATHLQLSDRDPFLNHYILCVKNLALAFPYFDPLEGARYKNGQADMFYEYRRMGVQMSCGDEPVEIYYRTEDHRYRLYSVPRAVRVDYGNELLELMRAKYQDQGLWLLIDPEDWADPAPPSGGRPRSNAVVSRSRPRSNAVGPWAIHPPKIKRLFRWA
jgi:hypothetical protein